MWSILRADVTYHKWILVVAYVIGVLVLVGDAVLGIFSIDMLMGITTLSFYASMWIIGANENKERRDRFHTALPNPMKQLGAARLLFVVLFQAGMLLLWFTLFLGKYTSQADRIVWNMLSINALNVIVVCLFVIHHDLGFFRTRAYRIPFLAAVLSAFSLLILLSIDGLIHYPLNFGPDVRISPLETMIYHILCVGLIYFDFVLFVRRRSYLE